ncbi:MAG: hypothetical protein JL56_06070 [Desulfotomaculum sp. BICA1-6]|nr:MAG: hypothetical protein JL56_06070 [Desulfotomaculum sp. BICA1-6]
MPIKMRIHAANTKEDTTEEGDDIKGEAARARAVGKERDAAILDLIQRCKYISRDQVQAMLFGHAYRQKCCERLTKLYRAGKVSRKRVEASRPFIYFPAGVRWNQKVEHYLTLNWVYISLKKQIKSWFKLHVFDREHFCKWDDGHLLADALVVLKNTAIKKLHPVFVEIDRGQSNNRFDKVLKYTDYYRSKAWVHEWWAQPDQESRYRFPKVLVVTDRSELVQKVIDRENGAGIRFIVLPEVDIMKDIYSFI